jgi:eukaryotic-like serine/threonine-protein kinase
MALTDSPSLRQLLTHLFPGIVIQENLRPSGQRLVYFCRFRSEPTAPVHWLEWGDVVLKVSEDIHPTVIARLEKERDILNELKSHFFPTLLFYQVFTDDPTKDEKLPYRLFVTIEERIAGEPLSNCQAAFSGQTHVVNLLRQLVQGLRLLWENPRRIVHRDLKPDNIIIRTDGTPVIIDLGIIREQGSAGVTGTLWNIGPCTPGYASPEQLRNEKRTIDFRADVFSLGVIAYELLSGSHPFKVSDTDPVDIVIHRTLNDIPTSLGSLGRASPPLSALVHSMTAKEAYRRPRTTQELFNKLSAIEGAL